MKDHSVTKHIERMEYSQQFVLVHMGTQLG